jgi:hypothetical protein
MNCEDTHELAAASSCKIGLTELALVEAHLRQCAACREASRDHQSPPPPERAASLAIVRVRLGALRASGPALSARAGAVAGDAVRHGAALSARARTALAETARAGAGALRVTPGLRARVGGLRARLAALPTPLRPAVRLVWLGVLATLAVYAGHSALRPRAPGPIGTGTDARLAPALVESPAPSPARLDVEAAPPATIESSTPAEPERAAPAELESGVALAALSAGRPEPEVRRAPAPPAPPSAPVQKPEPARAPLPAPKRAETASPNPTPRRLPTLAHVAGQLSVKNRGMAERDLTALLARTGGSLVGADRDGAVMFLDAVVPQSGYEEFTRGLARIGAWRVEAERSPLPEDVHLTIRVGG